MNPYKVKFEIEMGQNQNFSINIQKTDETSQYIENLRELLPEIYPDVDLQSNGELVKLKSENANQLLTTFEALLEAICNVEINS